MRFRLFLIFLCLPFTAGRELAAQSVHDSLQKIADKIYRLTDLKMSEDGKWITIRKSYDPDSDTVVIFSSLHPGQPAGYRIKVKNIVFLSNDNLLIQGPQQAELFNPETQTSTYFKGVKQIRALKSNRQFLLHYDEKEKSRLELRDSSGELLNATYNVSRFYTTGNDSIYVITEEDSRKFRIVLLKDKMTERIYAASQKISYLEPDAAGPGIMIFEQNQDGDTQKVLYLDLTTKNIFPLKESLSVPIQSAFSEVIREGSTYFLKLLVHGEKTDTSLVDIWYGNDNNLKDKFYPTARRLSYVWEPKRETAQLIGNDQMTSGITLGNDRFFLSFNELLFNDYKRYVPYLKLCLYDHQSGVYSVIDTILPELYASKKGECIIYKKSDSWCFHNFATGVEKIITDTMLRKPYFSPDGKSVMFDGEGGLWRYFPEKDDLDRLNNFTGYVTTILNGTSEALNCFSFYTNTVDEQQPLIIRLYDSQENRSAYLLLESGGYDTIIPLTCNRIQSLIYNKTYSRFCFVEEDYNLPPRLVYKESGKEEKVIFQSNKADTAILSLKKEIFSFTNDDGTPLKSILYYPLKYNPTQKYPVVVHIYQVQSNKVSNEYPVASYGKANCDGFNLRLLLERGYFVYFPDIVYGKRGTGLSALDCINHALDAIENNTSIDKSRIGLIGHSHGGYETNFIATHSNRFAAYVSGAGNSDIVRSYFSFNYNFRSPFYWQYENGQYEMNKSFSEAKDLYFQNNPIHYVDQVNAPILLWAGMKDQNIHWEQTMEFYIGLKRYDKKVITLFYPNEGHALFNPEACRDLVIRLMDWFDYFLKEERDKDWINKEIKEDANRHPPVL